MTSDLVVDYSNVAGVSDESNFKLLKRDDAQNPWADVTGSAVQNTVNHTFTITGVTDYSEFAIGEGGAIRVQTKIFLQGPYDTAGDTMSTALNASLPLTSPYSEDARTVSSIPSDVVDWVMVELRSTTDGAAVVSQSVLLHKDGRIVADDGTTSYIDISTSAGDYFIVIKHRNHVNVMSATMHTLSSGSSTLYDFTTGTDRFYGSDAKLLDSDPSNIYGMYAGDTDASGTVDANDRAATWNDRNLTGYRDSNCTLSGTVDANDRAVTWNNRNKATNVP